VPNKHFSRIEKARRQLARANIQVYQCAMMVKALKSFKDARDFDSAIQEWEARPAVLQTYKNLKVVMCAKYSKLNCQDAVSARATGHALANTVEEYAQAMEELIAELMERHAKQIKALIKANSKAMAKLTTAVPAAATPVAATRPP
jgi:phosphoglycerate dehydrogenase-like enzyme